MSEMRKLSICFNVLIFGITVLVNLPLFRKEGRWTLDRAKSALRYFTEQSNVLCAVAALSMCVAPASQWAWVLKYIGTVAVAVTMLTVLFFPGPSMGSYKPLLSGASFFLHLLTPLLALVSFAAWERKEMGFGTALMGMLPVLLYGAFYLYKVVYAPGGRRWEDFYGFNKQGKWPIAFAAMLSGPSLIVWA